MKAWHFFGAGALWVLCKMIFAGWPNGGDSGEIFLMSIGGFLFLFLACAVAKSFDLDREEGTHATRNSLWILGGWTLITSAGSIAAFIIVLIIMLVK